MSQTIVAQPALFSVEYALSRLLASMDINPTAMLGHSVSEYVAACLSGVFSPEAAMRTICKRGQLVQSVPEGSMLAIRLSENDLQAYLDNQLDLGSTLATEHSVASGEPEGIAQLETRLRKNGAVTQLSNGALNTEQVTATFIRGP
ncbi:acyltransferase domain-containing protein [Opitutia bacterium ISCC 51]|nr:acyltransferase domain-containing protein [Opitutae bacterium ISCC 51]QXD29087.1 acyltransferase domain-containing protein [Opitutae bacterium ISCC 52]